MPYKDKEEIRAYKRAYYKVHRKEENERRRVYHKVHRKEENERTKIYYETNKEKIKAQMRAYRETNKEKINAKKRTYYETNKEKVRASQIKYNYGLNLEQINKILIKQDYKCAICDRSLIETRGCIDHDHKVKEVRGILCHQCNTGLGLLNENPELLRKAALYIETWLTTK